MRRRRRRRRTYAVVEEKEIVAKFVRWSSVPDASTLVFGT